MSYSSNVIVQDRGIICEISIGDTAKLELDQSGLMLRHCWLGKDWIDHGPSGKFITGQVVEINMDSSYFAVQGINPTLRYFIISLPLPGAVQWVDGMFSWDGYLEFERGKNKEKNVCECGHDKAGDSGLHSDWCPKYEPF